MRRGCTVVLYDHTEYTRTRAFQTLRASLWDHVRYTLSPVPSGCASTYTCVASDIPPPATASARSPTATC